MIDHIRLGKWRDLNSQLLEQQFSKLSVKPFDNTSTVIERGLFSGLPSRPIS